jgi:hypothetical protein
MKTFALQSGDLVISGGGYQMVTGMARVQQQIGLCLREPYGSDRFHDRWGSVLPNWIGTVIEGPNIQMELRAELIRVVKNFISSQSALISQRAVNGLRSVLSPAETLVDISNIKIIQNQDTLVVKATLRTAGGQEFSIMTSPGRPDGYTQ